nr:hypothetical protein [Wadden Sea poxvirus]
MKRGLFISIEGLDKVGKTTQCNKLLTYLINNGHKVEYFCFPARFTDIGKILTSYLKFEKKLDDRTIHLLFSANRWEFASLLEERLNNGISIIVDRYVLSGVAYTSAKGIDINWCKQCDHGLLKPDIVIFMKIDINILSTRLFGEERYENISFQRLVNEKFKQIIKNESINFKIVNASKSIDEIHEDIKCIINNIINDKRYPIEKLW